MPKESIKDKLDGKELDLSLGDLTTVPVKELVRFTSIIAPSLQSAYRHCTDYSVLLFDNS